MKSFRKILFAAFVLVIVAIPATASVYETNNTPGYIKKIVMRSVVDCGYYYTASTCEHYLNYGETMSYEDFTVYGDPNCYYTYSVDGITWIPGGGGGVLALSLTIASGWEFVSDVPYGSSNIFYGLGADTVTLRARDAWGNLAYSDVQWHITDLINDVVTHDWATQPTITFSDLSSGKAFLVRSRRTGNTGQYEAELSFAGGSWNYGSAGIRSEPDNSWPYGAQRQGACSIACLRGVLHIKGKTVPTENTIVQTLVNNGKPESDFLTDVGMGHNEAEQRFNQVLNPYELTATNRNPITRDEIIAKLTNGQVLIVGTKAWVGDLYDINNPRREVPHMIVMRRVNNIFGDGFKIEIMDPYDGTKKKYTIDEAMGKIVFGGNPPQTSRIWEITP